MSEQSKSDASQNDSLNLTELIPDLFQRYFEFFKPGHQEGVVPSRTKTRRRRVAGEASGVAVVQLRDLEPREFFRTRIDDRPVPRTRATARNRWGAQGGM